MQMAVSVNTAILVRFETKNTVFVVEEKLFDIIILLFFKKALWRSHIFCTEPFSVPLRINIKI